MTLGQTRLLRQLLISLVVLAIAGFAYVWFVPGAAETLQRLGIPVPGPAATTAATQPSGGAPGGNAPAPGGQQAQPGAGPGGAAGAGGPRRGAREMVVLTAPVTTASINDKLTAIGEGEAAHSVTVMSPSNGTLRELTARPGEMVAAGAIIGSLDSDSEQIAFDRATLAKKDADGTLARTQGLAKANAATAVQINTAQLAADNAALEFANAKLALDRRTIISPIAGSVGLFQVSPGNAVSAQSIVTTIEDTSFIRISFWVPERYASAIAIGAVVDVSAVALPGEKMQGEVVAIDNRIDPASRTLKVQAQIANDAGKLRPGMSFSVSLAFPGEAFPAVDPLAIQWSSDGAYLWKYAGGKVERLLVDIIQRNSDGVLVKGDLAAGDQVVTQGLQQLTAGASVRLLDAAPGGRGPAGGGQGNAPAGEGQQPQQPQQGRGG